MIPMSDSSQAVVSIIVPVYNSCKHLGDCLDSIRNQSYTNLDIVLIDDGSTDGSAEICDKYSKKDSRIRVVHQSNGGIGKAQNVGIDLARGRFLAFADNDDILDRHNIELLLSALISTGADMSKGRWRQFGVSHLPQIRQKAAIGAEEPSHITVFKKPLQAYQNVFCKSLRLLGTYMGKRSESKYFNEANWCRLYRRDLWKGIRFPEGAYAQDVMVAGDLYVRMSKVADIDAVLYYWLQTPDSVTHRERGFQFCNDNFVAGVHNFALAKKQGILPARSYYTIKGALDDERRSLHREPSVADYRHFIQDRQTASAQIAQLSALQHTTCAILRLIRLIEKHLYDLVIKNMR